MKQSHPLLAAVIVSTLSGCAGQTSTPATPQPVRDDQAATTAARTPRPRAPRRGGRDAVGDLTVVFSNNVDGEIEPCG